MPRLAQLTAYAIGVLCLYCTVCAVILITAGIGLSRVVAAQQALGTGMAGRQSHLLVAARGDVIVRSG